MRVVLVHTIWELRSFARPLDRLSMCLPLLVTDDDTNRDLVEIQYLADCQPMVSVHKAKFTASSDMYSDIGTRSIE